jgi:serine/threonine protein kinase
METPKPRDLTEDALDRASAPTQLPPGPSRAVASDATVARENAATVAITTENAPTLASGAAPAQLPNNADYEIIRELGRGGMGTVYLAHNRLMGRNEVLKVMGRGIIDHPGALDRFLREIRAVARLRHPNIVTAYSAFRSGDSLVFAMEYVEGHDLDKLVKARGPMPVSHACAFIHQAALGLQHAHEEGMIHRDIKPGNLMLSRPKDRAVIKVLDFGLAKASREEKAAGSITQEGAVLGTPDFMAPEQIDDAQTADIRADIYSLGCTLYFLLSGHAPFPEPNLFEILLAHHTRDAPLLDCLRTEVPGELAALVVKMMAKDPGGRYQTPAEVAQALAPFFKRNLAGRAVTGLASAPAATTERAAPSIEPDQSRQPETTNRSTLQSVPDPVAELVETTSAPESMWASLIDFQRIGKEPELAAEVSKDETASTSPRWLWPAVGVAALVLGAVVILSVSPWWNSAPTVAARIDDESETTGTESVSANRNSPDVEISKPDATPRAAAVQGASKLGDHQSAPKESAPFGAASEPPVANPPVVSSKGEKPLVATANPPAPLAADVPDRSVASAKAGLKTPPLPPKSLRWTWIHDASLPAFDKWVESMRKRGYRPTFVNGHDRATRVRTGDEPHVPGEVHIAAVAVKDDRPRYFEPTLDVVEKGFDRLGEMQRRGYQLNNMTTFTNGTRAYVLAIYTEYQWAVGYWWFNHTDFPEPFLGKWLGKSDRPFTIAGRPEGDFWAMVAAARDTQGVPWQIRHGLNSNQLQEALGEAKAKGFRPETLFVCPGKARGGFGVVLTKDNPSLLWEVRADIPSTQLESDFAHMTAKGYALDQIVGYAAIPASRYLVSWTRDPSRHPATGWCDGWLEGVDEALEQFLLERRVPYCTFAAMRSGRLLASRGYGSIDQKTREPIAPDVALPLGDVSVPLAAAAARSLVIKKKLRDDVRLSDILRAPSGSSTPKASSSGPPSELLKMPVANLLDGLITSAGKLSDHDRDQLTALAGGDRSSRIGGVETTDSGLRFALLAKVLAALTGKTPAHAIADEVLAPIRPTRGNAASANAESPSQALDLRASAHDLARFFGRYQLDGRPLSSRIRPAPGALLGREGSSLALIVRRDDLVYVILLRLPADAPPQFTGDLRAAVDRALDSPPSAQAAPAKRRSGSR